MRRQASSTAHPARTCTLTFPRPSPGPKTESLAGWGPQDQGSGAMRVVRECRLLPANPFPGLGPAWGSAAWTRPLLCQYLRAWEMPHQAGHSARNGSFVGNKGQCPQCGVGSQSSTTKLLPVTRAGPSTVPSVASPICEMKGWLQELLALLSAF